MRNCVDAAIRLDSKTCHDCAIVVAMVTPKYLGGWGVSSYQDMLTNEHTDALRPVNTVIQRVAINIDKAKEDAKRDIEGIIMALY